MRCSYKLKEPGAGRGEMGTKGSAQRAAGQEHLGLLG